MESERVLQENLDEKSEFQRLFQMYLLFEEKAERTRFILFLLPHIRPD